jgi:glycosyltransferase involved in cell wall biosynthesis
MRVLYSFPTRLGTPGIGTTAWHQVAALAELGAQVTAVCATSERPLPHSVRVVETLRPAGVRVPFRLLGFMSAVRLHDRRAAAALRRIHPSVDVVHAWPLGAERTLRAARDLDVPGLLERPNAHTRFAFEIVERVRRELGLPEDEDSPHHPDPRRLEREEREYALARRILCPSDFVAESFLRAGTAPDRLARHRYGYDPARFTASGRDCEARPFTAAFVGRGEPRKGLHLALRAWVDSGAAAGGVLLVAGPIEPAYRELLEPLLTHPSVREVGEVEDPAALMRSADVLILPSFEEGSALVTYEARACGCVLVVSDHSGAQCRDGEDALVHRAGDLADLTGHLRRLAEDGALLRRLREASLAGAGELTWTAAARTLAGVYASALAAPAPAGDPLPAPT